MKRIHFYWCGFKDFIGNSRLLSFKFIFLSVFFNQTTALPQNGDNAVVFSIAPGISTTLSSRQSEFDKNHFYTLSPHFGLTMELLYEQHLNRQMSINTGLGISFNNYEFYHYNYNSEYGHETESKEISTVAYKIPLIVKYEIRNTRFKGRLFSTFGSEIVIIHAYGEATHFDGQSFGGGGNIDSTLFAEYDSYSANANLRLGLEVNDLFNKNNLNFNASLVYQLFPYGQISITNTVYESGSVKIYNGILIPKLLIFYFGMHIPIFTDI